MDDTGLRTLLRLVHAGGPVAVRRALLETAGTPAAIHTGGPAAWREAGLTPAQCKALADSTPAVEHSTQWLADAPDTRHLIHWLHPDYPALLRRIPAPPLALFVDGDPACLWRPGVAVIGSRAPTPGGRDNAAAFARHIASAGFSVISGLASGIDAAAHAAALDAGGDTVAVLGSGIDIPYPRSNRRLHARIAEAGAVVSEYPPGTPARREQFPSRNRIVAGLALGTVVIEAAHRSGALITARLAADAGREVFAVPGSIHNPMARGCHRLLRDGASLVESPAEVLEPLGAVAADLADALRVRLSAPIQSAGTTPGLAPARAPQVPDLADPDYNRLWNALGHDPTGMDELVERSGLTVARASAMLLSLELDGRVSKAHGRYSRKT